MEELRTPSFAHELSARSEFVNGSSLYEDPQPNVLYREAFSANKDEGVIGIAHRPSRSAASLNQALQMQNSWRENDNLSRDSDADIVTRQRLVSQKLLGRKSAKGPPTPMSHQQLEVQQLRPPQQLQTEASDTSRRLFMSAANSDSGRWQAGQISSLQAESHPTLAQSFQAPGKRDFPQSGPPFPTVNQPDQQMLQSLMMSQMQQHQQNMQYPVGWPFLPYMPPAYPWPPMQQTRTPVAPLQAPLERRHTVEYTPKPLSTQPSQMLEKELSSSVFSSISEKSRKEAPLEITSEAVPEEGAPLEALSELVSRNRESQELIDKLKQELQEEKQARQRAEERSKGLEQAVAAMRAREQEVEGELLESVDRCKRLEVESRQARQRLKEAEAELESTRRKAQEEAERLVRLERKDVRLLADFEDIQARGQHELEALSEEKRRLEVELGELRKLPVSLEMLREDNEGLRARLQRAEKARSNLQELVTAFRQNSVDLEQANRRFAGESDALRKECNMLKLQLASKDTALSQLQVALFAGRQEKSDLQHQLRRLEEAASALDGRRTSFGAKLPNPAETAEGSFYAEGEGRQMDISREGGWGASADAQCSDEADLPQPALAPDKLLASVIKPSSVAMTPMEGICRNEVNGKAKSNRIVNNDEMRVAGVSTSVYKNRAQQLAGSDMRSSLTMEPPLDRDNHSLRTPLTNRQNERRETPRLKQDVHENGRREETPAKTPRLSPHSSALSTSLQDPLRSPTKEERQFAPDTSPGRQHPTPGGVNKGREPLPFATEQSLLETMDETAAIESKLMEVSLERSKLESEFAKLPQSAGRTMTERRRKQELEGRIEDLTKKIGWLRMELRERHVLHK